MTVDRAAPSLVTLSEIAEIEIFIVKRMKELTLGDRASMFNGAGYNFVGLRDWIPGDRLASIDWAQSSLTNFSPLIMREFEQPSTGRILAVADASASTRCGIGAMPLAAAIARSVAAVGMSAVLFQDMFGLVTFDDRCRQLISVPLRVGKPHVLYCLDLYQRAPKAGEEVGRDIAVTIEGHLRRTSLIPVISDFLFADAPRLIDDLSHMNAVHDVFLVVADARDAYRLPPTSAGWIDVFDVETGATETVSSRELARLAEHAEAWQQHIVALARDNDIDVVMIGLDRWAMETTLVEFAAERRLRKV